MRVQHPFRAPWLPMSLAAAIVGLAAAFPSARTSAQAPALSPLEALVAAYPDHLSRVDGNVLIWRDGTEMIIDDGLAKDHYGRLEDADIEDMLSQVYAIGACSFAAPGIDVEPGRIRAEAFFRKMYGASAAAVESNLTTIDWFGTSVRVTSVNGVDRALAAVRDEVSALPAEMARFFVPTAGAYNWRVVAGTDRLSVHSFGAAFDINVAFADYWLWSSPTRRESDVPPYRNQIPRQIVEIFERHGFIWGGKWYHFDTMHFEYRPELLALAAEAAC